MEGLQDYIIKMAPEKIFNNVVYWKNVGKANDRRKIYVVVDCPRYIPRSHDENESNFSEDIEGFPHKRIPQTS